MSENWNEVGRQGKPAHASALDNDGEAAYVQRLVRALRNRKDLDKPMLISYLNDPNVPESSPFPDVLRVRYSKLLGLLKHYSDIFRLHNDPAQHKQWFVSLVEESSDDDELAYLKEVAAILRPGSWSNGGQVGDKLPLPRHLKTDGVTLKQLAVKFPNIVEMKVDGTTTYYRRFTVARVDGSQPTRALGYSAAQPSNPNLLLPKESRNGDWICERRGCGNVNFAWRKKCGNFDCDATQPAGTPGPLTLGNSTCDELAYLKEVAVLLSAKSWAGGTFIAQKFILPQHLKRKGVTFKQLVGNYPDIVEMRYNPGGDVSYRRGKGNDLADSPALPGNSNLPGNHTLSVGAPFLTHLLVVGGGRPAMRHATLGVCVCVRANESRHTFLAEKKNRKYGYKRGFWDHRQVQVEESSD
jgi:hypothetical protein